MTNPAILEKVRKLLRLAESPNVNEAAAAAAKAQRLIDEHHLSTTMLEMDGGQAEPDEPIVDWSTRGAPLFERYSMRYQYYLSYHLSQANGCKIFLSGKLLQIIGRPSDAETVRYLFAFLLRQVERLADEQGRGAGMTWRNNFKLGVVETIGRRIREERDRFKADATAGSNGLALVRVNAALAKVEERRQSVEVWTKTNKKLRAGSDTSAKFDLNARALGRLAGKTVSLGGASGAIGSGTKKLAGGR